MKRDEVLKSVSGILSNARDLLSAFEKYRDTKKLSQAEWRLLERAAEREARADSPNLVDPENLTEAETARLFGVSKRTVGNWKNTPKFPVQPGKRNALRACEIFKFHTDRHEAELIRAKLMSAMPSSDLDDQLKVNQIRKLEITIEKMQEHLIPQAAATEAVGLALSGTGDLVNKILRAVCTECRDAAEQIWTDGVPGLERFIKLIKPRAEYHEDPEEETDGA